MIFKARRKNLRRPTGTRGEALPPMCVYQVAGWANECMGLEGIGRDLKPFHLIPSTDCYAAVWYRTSSDSRRAAEG